MNSEKKSVILFHSTNYALWASDELHNRDIKSDLISVPRHLSSDCGYCVQIYTNDRESAAEILTEQKIDFDDIVDM